MRDRGVRYLFQNENGHYIAVCSDGSMWIATNISAMGETTWMKIDEVPNKGL